MQRARDGTYGMNKHDTSDLSLWLASAAGDQLAFGVVFDRHVTAVFNYCAYRTGSYSDADDLTSSVFLEAWRVAHRLTLTTPSAIPLLFGIASNVCSHHRRATTRARRLISKLHRRDDAEDHADAVAERVDAESYAHGAHSALAALSPPLRAVAELCLIAQMDTKTAADSLGIPDGTVKSRLSRARSILRMSISVSAGIGQGS
jgi:RNA polymerase sigma factor (sigma-70 family)